MEENIVKYEEILTHLEGLYSARVKKYPDEMKELTKNFKVIEERRSTVRTKVKDALAAVEEARNKDQQQRAEEDVPVLPRRGKRDGEKQLKCQREHTQNASAQSILLSWQKIGRET